MKHFQRIAEHTRDNCPVSQALRGVEINLSTELVQTAR